jgi:hypothetical protein
MDAYTQVHAHKKRRKHLSRRCVTDGTGQNSRQMSVAELEATLKGSTHRTLDLDEYLAHLDKWFKVVGLLRNHYLLPEYRLMKLHAKIGRQRSVARYVQRLKDVAGPPDQCIVALGHWSFSGFTGKSPQRLVYNALAAAGFKVYFVNEALTSRRCSGCQSQDADCHNFRLCQAHAAAPRLSLRWGLSQCQRCGTRFNRDKNGSDNIYISALHSLFGVDRPDYLTIPSPRSRASALASA